MVLVQIHTVPVHAETALRQFTVSRLWNYQVPVLIVRTYGMNGGNDGFGNATARKINGLTGRTVLLRATDTHSQFLRSGQSVTDSVTNTVLMFRAEGAYLLSSLIYF